MYHLLGTIPDIRVVQNRGQEQIKYHHYRKSIASDIEWRSKRCSSVVNLSPINAQWQQTKARIHLSTEIY